MRGSYKTSHGIDSTEFIQIFVTAAWKMDELFGLMGRRKQTFAKPDANSGIGVTMHNEKRRSHAADEPVGMKLIAHQ